MLWRSHASFRILLESVRRVDLSAALGKDYNVDTILSIDDQELGL